MRKPVFLFVAAIAPLWIAFVSESPVAAADTEADKEVKKIVASPEKEALGDLFGPLANQGLKLDLCTTQVYQDVVRGGLATHRHTGRYSGAAEFEVEADLEKIADLKGASLYLDVVDSNWSDGIDASSIHSVLGVNEVAGGDEAWLFSKFWYEQVLFGGNGKLRLGTEFWYEHSFLDDRVIVRVGRFGMDEGVKCRNLEFEYDGNAYAKDEETQFLNSALVDNPTIPFPEDGIGAFVYVQPAEGWYVLAEIADAQAEEMDMYIDAVHPGNGPSLRQLYKSAFRTAFHGEDYTFTAVEGGHVCHLPSANGPMQGTHRVGLWYDPQPKEKFDGSGIKRDDLGMYISADQMFYREKSDPKDSQGLGAFFRLGVTHKAVNEIPLFWSIGCQYEGLVPGRDADVLGVGMVRGRLSDEPGSGFEASHETALEVYYSIKLAKGVYVSPDFQYVANPGGVIGVRDAIVMGVRIHAKF